MSLLKNFKRSDPTKHVLPKPDGPLATQMPSSSIVAANREVKAVLESSPGQSNEKKPAKSSKRGHYDSYSPEERASIGKRAAEHGVTATIRYIRTWKKSTQLN